MKGLAWLILFAIIGLGRGGMDDLLQFSAARRSRRSSRGLQEEPCHTAKPPTRVRTAKQIRRSRLLRELRAKLRLSMSRRESAMVAASESSLQRRKRRLEEREVRVAVRARTVATAWNEGLGVSTNP